MVTHHPIPILNGIHNQVHNTGGETRGLKFNYINEITTKASIVNTEGTYIDPLIHRSSSNRGVGLIF